MRGFVPHYIAHNLTSRQPRRWVWLDTEAHRTDTATGERQTWRLGVTAFDDRAPGRRTPHVTEWGYHATPDELWRWVSAKAKRRARTMVMAHNLAYDLRIAAAFDVLPALGWRIDIARLDGRTCWARWRRDEATLLMGDTADWFPVPLHELGGLVDTRKVPLPAELDAESEWWRRCTTDVAIMRAAMLRVLDWHERRNLGNLQVTSASSAWSAWRHRFMADQVLVHGDQDARDAERRGCWAGRCEAWRHGQLRGRSWEEWDMRRAYPTIARQCAVPVKLTGLYGPRSPEQLARLLTTGATLVEATVSQERPVVPAHHDGGIVWPVGTFRTTLWDPEVRALQAAGGELDVHRAWHYRTAPALQAWARWVLSLADGRGDGRDPVIALVAKTWSRALIGRFGLRYPTWEPFGDATDHAVMLTQGTDADTGERYKMLQLGGRVLIEAGVTDGHDSVPSIVGWIMSECRVRLWAAMNAVGLDNVAYVDTDSIIVKVPLGDAGDRMRRALDRRGFTLKRRYRTLQVLGPHQLISAGKLTAAGVPRNAEVTSGGSWKGVVWQSLAVALGQGVTDSVELRSRTYRIKGRDRRRLHRPAGETQAIRVAV